MTLHTMGPWAYDPRSGWISADNCCHRGSMHVADIRGWGHLTGGGMAHALPPKEAKEIQDANAKLICAAPEMLAVLKHVAQAHPIDMVMAVIAKAEAV